MEQTSGLPGAGSPRSGRERGGGPGGPWVGGRVGRGVQTVGRPCDAARTGSLRGTGRWLVREGRGVLAGDERPATIAKRFARVGLASTPNTRHAYRDMLLGADGIGESLSGVILSDETIRQATSSGVPFPEHLTAQGVLVGIKVDRGCHPIAGFPGETSIEGLDDLRERLTEYRA